jgi:hypothetical protein
MNMEDFMIMLCRLRPRRRVPAIIVSPLIEKGIIDHTVYDHTSALATVERILNMSPLTKRDAAANNFLHLFTLDAPRGDTPPVLTTGATPAEAAEALTAAPEETLQSLTSTLADLESPLSPTASSAAPVPPAEQEASGPQVGFAYIGLLRALSQAQDPKERELWRREFTTIRTRRDAARFMTRAKLKVQYNIYSPPNTIPEGHGN